MWRSAIIRTRRKAELGDLLERSPLGRSGCRQDDRRALMSITLTETFTDYELMKLACCLILVVFHCLPPLGTSSPVKVRRPFSDK